MSQYGLRIRTKEFETVSWDEFKSLIAGISPDTVLGRVVSIRSETDPEVIKHFTTDQRRIYDEWKAHEAKRIKDIPKEIFEREMANLEKMFAAMCQ